MGQAETVETAPLLKKPVEVKVTKVESEPVATKNDGLVPSSEYYTREDVLKFCSAYTACFFLGIFISPIFYLCGMLGLRSNKPNEIWAGRASALACSIFLVILVIYIFIVAVICATEKEDEDYYEDY